MNELIEQFLEMTPDDRQRLIDSINALIVALGGEYEPDPR